jgi:hypothetical protein
MAHPVLDRSICWLPGPPRYDFGMARTAEPFTPADDAPLARFENHYTILAVCGCGHSRELHTLFLRRQLGIGVTMGKVRDSLRCHKCQKRGPTITVTRTSR